MEPAHALDASVFDLSPDPIIVADREGWLKEVNPAGERLSGYSRIELLDRPYASFIHADDHAVMWEAIARVLNGSTVRDVQLRLLTKRGGCLWLEWTSCLVASGTKFLAIGRDITARKEAEAALRQSEQTYRTLVDNLPQYVFLKDTNSDYLSCNRSYAALFGIEPDAIRGKSMHELHPTHLADKYRADDLRIIADGGTVAYDEPFVRCGKELVIHTVKTPIKDDQGRVAAILGIFWDVTEKKRADELIRRKNQELEAMFASTHVHIAVLNRRFDFLRVNAAYARAADVSAQELQGRNHFELYPHPENERIFRTVVDTGVPFAITARPFEYPDQPERGTTYWDWTLVPLKATDGSIDGLILTLVDATERERQRVAAESTWQRAQAELESRITERTREFEAANRELESFSYTVSHDLRAPLRAINGYSEALREELGNALSGDASFFLERIRASTVNMAQLIDGLLKMAQVSRRELCPTEIDLSAMANRILSSFHENEPARTMDWHVEEGLIEAGDLTLFQVLLENLFHNAWKFTARQPRGRIEFGKESRDCCDVYFVRDNGIGFDNQFANKLFRPFERLHDAAEFDGTGIGLATVSRIVKRHGGCVWAQGAPDAGATIYFTLNVEECES